MLFNTIHWLSIQNPFLLQLPIHFHYYTQPLQIKPCLYFDIVIQSKFKLQTNFQSKNTKVLKLQINSNHKLHISTIQILLSNESARLSGAYCNYLQLRNQINELTFKGYEAFNSIFHNTHSYARPTSSNGSSSANNI